MGRHTRVGGQSALRTLVGFGFPPRLGEGA
jgi:hypothetical protein